MRGELSLGWREQAGAIYAFRVKLVSEVVFAALVIRFSNVVTMFKSSPTGNEIYWHGLVTVQAEARFSIGLGHATYSLATRYIAKPV